MSPAAVAKRLQDVSDLYDLARSLRSVRVVPLEKDAGADLTEPADERK